MDYRQAEIYDMQCALESQKQHDQMMLQESRMQQPYLAELYCRFSILQPSLTIDGNQWCCLYGDDLQTGIAGFGDTPEKAIQDWNSEMVKPITTTPEKEQ